MLTLTLKAIHVEDCYPATPELPARMALLHPEAADSIEALQKAAGSRIVLSDAFRTPESSLQAARAKRGVQPPGFSAHNFGLAIDVDVDATLKAWNLSYSLLCGTLADYGWHCHRRDGGRGMESWHFNFLGTGPASTRFLNLVSAMPSTWARAAEARILDLYGPDLTMTAHEAQVALEKLRFYNGAIDGVIGPRTRAAIGAFQRAWEVRFNEGENPETLTPRTQRVLAVVSAVRRVVT